MSYTDWLGEDRRVRAYRMYTDAADHHIVRRFPRRGVWIVRSQRRAGLAYSVNPKLRTCTCADFRRNAPTTPAFLCKHLYLIAIFERGGRLLRVRGRALFAGGPYLEDAAPGVREHHAGEPMDGRYAVRALAPFHAFVVDIGTGKPVCGHAHDEAKLRAWFTSGAAAGAAAPCPRCIGDTMDLLLVGAPPLPAGGPPAPKAAPKAALSDEEERALRASIKDRNNAALIDDILTRYFDAEEPRKLQFFDPSTADVEADELLNANIADRVFAMMLGLTSPAPEREEFDGPLPLDDITYLFNSDSPPKGKYDPLSAEDLTTLWKLWDPAKRIAADGKLGYWEGKISTKKQRATALYDLVFNPSRGIRPTAGGAQRERGVVERDSLLAKLNKDAPPEFRLRVYGQSRCDEVVSRNLGLASLSSYQKIIQWAIRGGVKNTHSFLLHHDTGAGKTASLWLALGDAWKERTGRYRQKYFFVTKANLSKQQQPAKDVWAFYHAADDATSAPPVGAYAAVREQTQEAGTGSPPYVQWKKFVPTSPAKDEARIISYAQLSNMCRRGNDMGRAIYDYEAAHEIAAWMASPEATDEDKAPTTLVEKVLSGHAGAIGNENFPADLENIRVARAAKARAAKSKSLVALDTARGELLEYVEFMNGVKRAWTHLQFMRPKAGGDSSSQKLHKRFEYAALLAKIAKLKAKLAAEAGEDAAADPDFHAGVIDPLRDAVIAIDEADVMFSEGAEISDATLGVIERAVFHSYKHSGSAAVRVILGTATPAQLSVRAAFRLLNMLVRTNEQRVQGVGSGGAGYEDTYIDADSSPTVAKLAGAEGNFKTPDMNKFMNVVKDGISRVDLARDFDHFPHRIRHTVEVTPSLAHAGVYKAVLKRALKVKDAAVAVPPSPSPSPSPSPGPGPGPSQPKKKEQSPADKILGKARKLRERENLIPPKGETSVPFEFRLGHPKFDERKLADWVNTVPYTPDDADDTVDPLEYNNAPKLMQLLAKIREIDDAARLDPKRTAAGVGLPKHAIVCDAKKEFGAPLVAAVLAVAGYPWRPVERYRTDRKERVRLLETTVELDAAALPFEESHRVRAEDVGVSAFAVLSAQQLDFETETAGKTPFLQRGKKGNENTEYVFVGALKLRKVLGITGAPAADAPWSEAFRTITKGGPKKIYRPPGWGEENAAEGGNNAPLDKMYLTKSVSVRQSKENIYAIIKPLLEKIAAGDSTASAVDTLRTDLASSSHGKMMTLKNLQALELVEWRAVLSAKQRMGAPGAVTKVFNSRSRNFANEQARIIVVAPEFATGTDLFEVEHIHLIDATERMDDAADATPTTRDRIQMEGRAWRNCGHAELRRRFGAETRLHIYEYRLNVGSVDPNDVLAYMRTTVGRKPGVVVADAKYEGRWQFDDVLQALRTDPADAAALRGINAKIEEFAFDRDQNSIPAKPVYTPLYTGYVHTGSVATPLYRSARGALVDVNGAAVGGVDDRSLLDLWDARRVRWDVYAGTWTGVADREQARIEDSLVQRVGGEISALIMLANAAFGAGGGIMEDVIARRGASAQSARGTHEEKVLHLEVLREILKEQEALQAKRKSKETSKYAEIIADIKKLVGFARNEEELARADADGTDDASQQRVEPRQWWKARAALYRARFTALPLRNGRDLQWVQGGIHEPTRVAPRRAAAAASPAKPASRVDETEGRPSDSRWYAQTRWYVQDAAKRAGFIIARRRARDLWFASHVRPALDGHSLLIDVVGAVRRMRTAAAGEDAGAGSVAAYIWSAFADLGDRRADTVRDVMTDETLLANVVRIATWLPARKFRADIRFFVRDLGIALPTVVNRVSEYALAPGQSGRARRTETVKALVTAQTTAGSILPRLRVALDDIFGKETSEAVLRVVVAGLPAYYDQRYAYQARAGTGAIEPTLAVGILDGVAKVVRFFDKATRLAPTKYYMRITALGRELAQADTMQAPHRRIWITAVLAARAVEEGVENSKTSMRNRITAAVMYLYTPADDLHPSIRCHATMRKEGVLERTMRPDGTAAGEELSAGTAAGILYKTYGDPTASLEKAQEIIGGKKRPTYLRIADTDAADAVFPGGRGADLTMAHAELTSISKYTLRYADANAGGVQTPIDADTALTMYDAKGRQKLPWAAQIANWIATGLVEVTDAGEFAKIGGMDATAKAALETVFTKWMGGDKKVAPTTRNAVKAYLASLDAGASVGRAAAIAYLEKRKGEIYWINDADWRGNFFSLLARAEPHWDAVISMRDMVVRVFVTLDANVALRIAINGERAASIGALDTLNAQDVADFIANTYVNKVTALRTVTETLKPALSAAAIGVGINDRKIFVQWILDGPAGGTPADFAVVVKARASGDGGAAALDAILAKEPIPRGIAIQKDIAPNDPRTVYIDIMQSDQAKAAAAAFEKAIRDARPAAVRKVKGPLPATRERKGAPFQHTAEAVERVLHNLDMLHDGYITIDGNEMAAFGADIRGWDLATARKVFKEVRRVRDQYPTVDEEVRETIATMRMNIQDYNPKNPQVPPIGAAMRAVRDQPLRIVSPAHLHGQLVPQHIARRLVWTASAPAERRLVLASGRAELPSGHILDPWEEEDDVIVEFF